MTARADAYRPSAMRRAIALSRTSIANGNEPFAAVIVRDGVRIGEGMNQANELHDPTAHGEVQAIRDACRRLGRTDLSGAVLYTSCEPCALCLAAMAVAGIRRMHYAATLAECEGLFAGNDALGRSPATPVVIRAAAAAPCGEGILTSNQHMAAAALAVVAEWLAQRAASPSSSTRTISRAAGQKHRRNKLEGGARE